MVIASRAVPKSISIMSRIALVIAPRSAPILMMFAITKSETQK